MKKSLLFCLIGFFMLTLVSWGKLGHYAIGRIAERHLSPVSKVAIKELIGDTSLAEISTYADQIRSHEEYKYTAPFHYINLPLGLSRDDFKRTVSEQTQSNVYSALVNYEHDLIAPGKSKAEKIFALKMIVHFVGDLHQPMHVSRAEDQGGNAIHISFLGQPGNLHGLWDSGLLEHAGMNYQQLADQIDLASADQIIQWQNDSILDWLFESYQVSSQLYADAAKSPDFDEAYYQSHLPIIKERLEKAGIRLAGILNEAFSGGPYHIIPPPPVFSMSIQGDTKPNGAANTLQQDTVKSKDVAKYIGKVVVATGPVSTTRLIESNNMTLLNIGGAYPDQDFTIMIKSENRAKFGQPEVTLKGKVITVKGLVIDYRGKPEIELTDPKQLSY